MKGTSKKSSKKKLADKNKIVGGMSRIDTLQRGLEAKEREKRRRYESLHDSARGR